MSEITMTKCDCCGKIVNNHYAERGWIHFDVKTSIVRSHGVYGESCYKTDFLQSVNDFCGIECMILALDRSRENKNIRK